MIDETARDEAAKIAAASAQIDAFIEPRATQNERVNAEEMMWKAIVRKHHDKLRTERLHDRLAWHRAMLETHTRTFEALLRRHRVGLRLCEEALGIAEGEGGCIVDGALRRL